MLGLPPAVLRVTMVLPVRIELTTSALPRMRSTTELRQHCLEDAGLWPWGAGAVKEKGVTEKNEKAERLAAALRENLRRRKAQARSLEESRKPDQP